MNEDDGFADWAFEAAGQVMEHVERHGVPISSAVDMMTANPLQLFAGAAGT